MMSNTYPETLFSLLENYSVQIPVVQRDYAQGRTDEHSCFVRENLLSDLKDSYESDSLIEPLDLSFVYGKISNDVFIPVDGQQRLTTLFLLHIYAFSNDSTMDYLLNKFSYESRKTTKDFLVALVKNRKAVFDSDLKPSAEILDSEWLNISWKYDPSVLAMLNMLNDIVAKGFDKENLKVQLLDTSNPRVVFKFLDLENIGMEDDLYIKLNARGRSLTLFENFKSNFVNVCKSKCNTTVYDSLIHKLDGSWADLFWSFIEKNRNINVGEENDRLYLKFFSYMFCNDFILDTNNSVAIPKNWIFNIDYNSISKDTIKTIYNTLNYICKSNKYSNIISKCLNSNSTFESRVILYAITKFLSDKDDPATVDNGAFDDWFRVIRNLIVNTNIDRYDRYVNAIKAIDNLSNSKDAIIDYLSTVSKRISGFDGFQFDEECKKARIIKADVHNRQLIIDAEEKLSYFDGQITCVLDLSDFEKTTNEKVLQDYIAKISYLFNDNEANHSNALRRALCTLGDYTVLVDNKYKTLCINDPKESSRTRSFKYLFSNYGYEVKTLVDSIDVNKDLLQQYNMFINNSTVLQNDWRFCFIKYPFLLDYMSKSHLRFIEMDGDAIMVPNKASNGYNYSAYLILLRQLLSKNNKEYEYVSEYGQYGSRFLTNKNNTVVSFKYGKYIINDNGNKVSFDGTDLIDKTLAYLISL